MEFEVLDKVKCVNIDILSDSGIGPELKLNESYVINEIIEDSKGNQHVDIGIKSKYNFIRSLETKEELPRGESIHWCHPSRFKKII